MHRHDKTPFGQSNYETLARAANGKSIYRNFAPSASPLDPPLNRPSGNSGPVVGFNRRKGIVSQQIAATIRVCQNANTLPRSSCATMEFVSAPILLFAIPIHTQTHQSCDCTSYTRVSGCLYPQQNPKASFAFSVYIYRDRGERLHGKGICNLYYPRTISIE